MNATIYVNDFYEAIKTHNEFFPEDLLNLDLYKDFSEEPVTEHEVDTVSELANRYIYKVIDVCNKGVGKDGYTSTCHFMADIHRRYLIERGIKPEEISLTVGQVYFEERPMYKATKAFIKQIVDEGPGSSLGLNFHCWLTYKNRYIIDPSLQFNLVKRGIFREGDLKDNNLVYALGEDYSSMKYTMSKPDGSVESKEVNEMLRYEPVLVDDDFYFRIQDPTLEYLELSSELKSLDAKTKVYIENGKKLMIDKLNYMKAMAGSYMQGALGQKIGRNDPCWCGSGLKFKKCHGRNC